MDEDGISVVDDRLVVLDIDEGSLAAESLSCSLATRSSVDAQGKSAFDRAVRVKLAPRYAFGLRQIKTGFHAFVNSTCTTQRYCPIQVRKKGQPDELRMRAIGCCAGNGCDLVFFDLELASVVSRVERLSTNVCCMSMSCPKRETKLAPLICIGMHDGRLNLIDVQSGAVLFYFALDTALTACHVCEGERSLVMGACEEVTGLKPTLYVFMFELGRLERQLSDHTSRITAITTCCVKHVHNFIVTASVDGTVLVYDMYTYECIYRFDDASPVLSISCVPANKSTNRPSLLLSGGVGGIIRCRNLETGELLSTMCPEGEGERGGTIRSLCAFQTMQKHAGCVSVGDDACIRVWDIEGFRLLLTLRNLHTECIQSVSVTQTPRFFIVTGGFDSRCIVVDLDTLAKNDLAVKAALAVLRTRHKKANSETVGGREEEEEEELEERDEVSPEDDGYEEGEGEEEKGESVVSDFHNRVVFEDD